MTRFWTGGTVTGTVSTSTTLDSNTLIYHNNSGLTTTTKKFDVTAVARHLCVISDTDDLWIARYIVVHESFPTLTVGSPGDSDDKVRGIFPWARGPVYFNPGAKISIPSDHKLFLQIAKRQGTTTSIFQCVHRTLLVTGD